MTFFSLKFQWVPTEGNDELAATLARLQIFLGKSNITEHRPPAKTASLQIPLYYLAEWIAENWWVLLFEPRKREDDEDPNFISRHSILAAQHGFPLPALTIIPFGRSIHLSNVPRRAPFSNVHFTTDAFGDTTRQEVEDALTNFVSEIINRLEAFGILDTSLQEVWKELQSLSDEEKQFCQLAGSLGIAPADASDQLANSIERIYDIFGDRAVRDYCFASTEEQVIQEIPFAEELVASLSKGGSVRLSPLFAARLPPENYVAPSWRRGLRAAKTVRESLKILAKDPSGADKFFKVLEIDTSNRAHLNSINSVPHLMGAIDRHEADAKLVLLQDKEFHRRFAAGRAAYLTWVSEEKSRRLITNAVTRDQQASRQFAAEILIPREELEARSGAKRELRSDQIYEAARERKVMPDVAFWQARNAGIRIIAI